MHLKNTTILYQIIDEYIESKKSDDNFKKAFKDKCGIELEEFNYIGKSNFIIILKL